MWVRILLPLFIKTNFKSIIRPKNLYLVNKNFKFIKKNLTNSRSLSTLAHSFQKNNIIHRYKSFNSTNTLGISTQSPKWVTVVTGGCSKSHHKYYSSAMVNPTNISIFFLLWSDKPNWLKNWYIYLPFFTNKYTVNFWHTTYQTPLLNNYDPSFRRLTLNGLLDNTVTVPFRLTKTIIDTNNMGAFINKKRDFLVFTKAKNTFNTPDSNPINWELNYLLLNTERRLRYSNLALLLTKSTRFRKLINKWSRWDSKKRIVFRHVYYNPSYNNDSSISVRTVKVGFYLHSQNFISNSLNTCTHLFECTPLWHTFSLNNPSIFLSKTSHMKLTSYK